MRRMSSYTKWSKDALISRILSLEEAAKSSTKPTVPAIPFTGPTNTHSPATAANGIPDPKFKMPKKKKKQLDFSKFTTRRVAFRFAYLGWKYHGLAYQKDGHPTVECRILDAFYKTSCIPTMNPMECNFSRCGRTDADVSAMAQVISLDIRSVLTPEEQADPSKDSQELNYLKILNSHLPEDILAYQVCLRPSPDFSARFSCISRHYHYYFTGNGLNIDAMQDAAARFVGSHDFRNFCKIDGSKQITNFRRQIMKSEICRREDNGLFYLSLQGNAFLWNQVRSIMAVLFMVGERLEQPDVVDKLLDVDQMPQRPAYEIAWGVPLVLYNCEYANMDWYASTYTSTDQLANAWHNMLQKESMAKLMIETVQPFSGPSHSGARVNVTGGVGKRSKHTPLLERPVAEDFETRNEKWRLKEKRKRADTPADDSMEE